jgi:hypothetical protein
MINIARRGDSTTQADGAIMGCKREATHREAELPDLEWVVSIVSGNAANVLRVLLLMDYVAISSSAASAQNAFAMPETNNEAAHTFARLKSHRLNSHTSPSKTPVPIRHTVATIAFACMVGTKSVHSETTKADGLRMTRGRLITAGEPRSYLNKA